MSVFAWLETQGTASREKRKNWLRRVTDRRRMRRHRGGAHSFQRRRALFESLEQRNLLTVAIWDGVGFELDQDGNIVREADGISWHDRLNWQGDVLPSPGDSIIIPDVPNTTTVRLNQGDWDVADIVSDVHFELLSGATLSVADTVQVNNGTFLIGGGTLDQATIVTGTGESEVRSTSGVLRNVTIDADILFDNNQTVIEDNLTLHATATIHGRRSNNPIFGRIAFAESAEGQTLDGTGTIEFTFSGITGQFHPGQIIVEGETTLTVGPDITIRGQRGLVGPSGGVAGSNTIVNQGTISADATGEITILPETFVNEGLVESHQFGNLRIASPEWTSTGTIRAADNRAVVLAGTFTLPSGHGFELENGGRIQQTGVLENEGNTVTIDTTDGSYQVEGGRIHGGTIMGPIDSELRFNFSTANLLRGVTLNVGMDLVSVNRARVRIEDGLTLNGTATVHGRRSNLEGDSRLIFSESAEGQTLDGTGTIEFTYSSSFTGGHHPGRLIVEGETTLTIGPEITIHGSHGEIGVSSSVPGENTIVNQGTISSDTTGEITISSAQFVHEGLLEASAGQVTLGVTPSNFQNGLLTGGSWAVRGNGVIRLNGVTNIEANAATLYLDGPSSRLLNSSGLDALAGLSDNTATGSIAIANGRHFVVDEFANAGIVSIGQASRFEVVNNFQQTGGHTQVLGTLASTLPLAIQDGVVSGTGVIEADVENQGRLEPGDPTGTLTIAGDYAQSANGELHVHLAGNGQFSRLDVTGTAVLGGTLGVSLVEPFLPDEGEEFVVVTYIERQGDFAVYEGLELSETRLLVPDLQSDSLVLSVTGIPSHAPFVVTTTADSGPGSLRQAILDANLAEEPVTITFTIPTSDTGFMTETLVMGDGHEEQYSVFVIQPESALPAMENSNFGITIDGRSQFDHTGDTNPFGPVIVLDGSLLDATVSGQDGLKLQSNNNQIVGLNIRSFPDVGVRITGNNNWLAGNYIGTDATGTVALGNGDDGIQIMPGSAGNVIGGTAPSERNVISGNAGDGVELWGLGTSENVVLGNYIGTDATGLATLGNGQSGVRVASGASNNVIGGTADGAGNVISGNSLHGVYIIRAGEGNRVSGNLIGTDATGTAALGNTGSGVGIDFSPNSIIGGNVPGARNVISGNLSNGIQIWGEDSIGNWIAGNYIGTDITGSEALGNVSAGVWVTLEASDNVIGTNGDGIDDEAERNVISGNLAHGIAINGAGTDHNVVAGNYIGTDASGAAAIGNGTELFQAGVHITDGARFNLIGTDGDGVADEAERNVISGNAGHGINLWDEGTDENVIAGNFIGTDAEGKTALGNGSSGIQLFVGPKYNRIGTDGNGTADAVQRNVISGNTTAGILLNGGGVEFNVVAGNYIGTDATGTVALGNGSHGVTLSAGASHNLIGTNGDGVADEAERNVISGNTLAGVQISNSHDNVVAGNYIGVDATGTEALGNGSEGVVVVSGATGNVIGTTGDVANPEAQRNVISGNERWAGVIIVASHDNVVAGNYIGTDASGTEALGVSGHGIEVKTGSTGNRIGTNGDGVGDEAERNVISGNAAAGIFIWEQGTDHNVVAGNYIGTDATGTAALGNGSQGVILSAGASNNLIGTDGDGMADEAERNVISGNTFVGVFISGDGTNDNVVSGNYIGTDVSGTVAMGNGGNGGVRILAGAKRNLIGTNGDGVNDDAKRNVISGNTRGVQIDGIGSDENVVAGNYIGTDATGTVPLPNATEGIRIVDGARANRIGTNGDGVADEAERNVISGNGSDGVRITGSGSEHNVVAGNLIGTDQSGTLDVPNEGRGIVINIAANNMIGGTTIAARNVISGNALWGIEIAGAASGTRIEGNYIGTDITGRAAIGNGVAGVWIHSNSDGNTVGGSVAGAGNVIAGNGGHGIQIANASHNRVQGNLIGMDAEGVSELGNAYGVVLNNGSRFNLIGTNGDGVGDEAERNVISGNTHSGVFITGVGTDHNVVAGNYIGTDVTGTAAIGNGTELFHAAVHITGGARFNLIGTDGDGVADEAERNVISGNIGHGVRVSDEGTDENVIAGNYIGVDVMGTAALANGWIGVTLAEGAKYNRIGTDGDGVNDEAERNVISGNFHNGVTISGAGTDHNVVAGNYIGTDVTGTAAIGNGTQSFHAGVRIAGGARFNLIGTNGDGVADEAERNLISGNTGHGVSITDEGTDENVISGNYIGVDVTGTAALANGWMGVHIRGAKHNRIGTDGDGVNDEAERNVISGNLREGITIRDAGTDHNVVAGNFIGTDASGTEDLGNGSHGVEIIDARDNQVGGDEGLGNTIAFNGGDGVRVTGSSAVGNTIRYNSIHSNIGLGIDLGGDGVTLNDPLDEDTGPNNLQNFPEIATAIPGGQTLVSGLLHSTPLSPFTLDFYANDEPHSSLHGQGQRWLGSAVVTTDAEGNAPFSLPLNAATSQGEWITATATAADGSTSEFSQSTVAAFPTAEIVGILPIAPNPRNAPVERVDLAFSHAIDPASFTPGAVSLTRNGQAVTVPSSVTFTTIGESTYRLAGLESATETDGDYELIVDASQLIDSFGNPAEGTATASWLMDTVKPTSKVDPLPRRAESLMFPVSVTGSDPAPAGVTPSGVVSYDLFVRVDGGPFEFWTTVPADEPVALFTAESSHRYGFRSVARDAAGNVETKEVKVEASIFVPDLDPPQTTITAIDSTSPTFVIEFSGTDTGGSGLAFFELYVAIDGGQPEQVATVNAGTADANGVHHGSATFQALADGEEHTYEFFTIGVDTAGNFEDPDETVSVTATFDTPEALEVVSFVVQHGMTQRSYIRFLEVTFNQKDPLPAMLDSLADENGETDRIRLRHVDYEGNLVGMVLDVSMLSISDHTILIDFGMEGIGGDRNSTAGDGFYELAFDLTDDGQWDAAQVFHRLLGDITGDRQVSSDDLDRVFAAWGSSGPNLEEDVNGSGAVTTEDLFLVWNLVGRKLDEDWPVFFDLP